MSIPITFQGQKAWKSGANRNSNRPYAKINLIGPNRTKYGIWTLVDTGADYTQLDEAFALSLGIPLNGTNASSIQCNYANGVSISQTLVSNVDLEIEGYRISTDVIFKKSGPDLLGRTSIVQAIDFGMDQRGWLYG